MTAPGRDAATHDLLGVGNPQKAPPSARRPLPPLAAAWHRLPAPCPWGFGDVAATMITYLCLLHVPLGVGGLSVCAALLHRSQLDPETKAVCLLLTGTAEAAGAAWLLAALPRPSAGRLPSGWFRFGGGALLGPRGLLPAVVLGMAGIACALGGLHAAEELLLSPPDAAPGGGAPPLAALLSAGPLSQAATAAAYLVVAPALEELVYRGYLFPCLASKLPAAASLLLSSLAFCLSHPASASERGDVFLVGCALGLAYAWTGDLAAPVALHQLSNLVALLAVSQVSTS